MIFNKTTKSENSLKTAIKNGILSNPDNFIFDKIINKETKRFITHTNANLLIKEGKPSNNFIMPPNFLFYKKFYVNTKANKTIIEKNKSLDIAISHKKKIDSLKTKKYDFFSLTKKQTPTALKPFFKYDYSFNLPSKIDAIEKPEQVNNIELVFRNSYKYLVSKNNLQDYKVQFVVDADNKFLSSSYNSDPETALSDLINKITALIQEYENFEFYIKNLSISFLKPDMSYIGASDLKFNEKMEVLGNKEYRIINTISFSNCLYHAFILGENPSKLTYFMNNNDALINTAKQLKKRLNPSNKMLSTFETIQELADYKKRMINVYDSILNLSETYKPKKDNNKSPVNIQIVNNHAKAMIPWADIDPKIKFEKDEEIKINSESRDKCTLIIKKNKPSEYDGKIAVWDIECTPDDDGNFKSYAVGLAYEDKYISFWGLDCLNQFMDFINKNFLFFNNYTFYAHNGGKFDFVLLIRESLINYKNIHIDPKSVVELNKAFIGASLVKGDLRINFKDSLRLLPQSLKALCLDFNVKYKKLDEKIKHDDINLKNYNSKSIFPLLYIYLRNDCLGLIEILKTFSLSVYKETNINITSCYTGASLAKKNYFSNYYNHLKNPIYTLSDDIDNFIRKGYAGGRNEAFHIGKIQEKIYYLDFTSLYPYTGTFKLPYDKPTQSTIDDYKILTLEDLKSRFGFYNVMVRTIDKTKKPIHGMKSKNGLFIFPILDSWTLFEGLFTEEIKEGIKNKIYEYQFLEGYEFKNAAFLKNTFIEGFENKAKAKLEGNEALSLCYKVIINSTYGFFGLNRRRDGIKVFHKDASGMIPILLNNKLISYCDYGDYSFVRCYNDLNIKDFNVSIASAISSYARIRLWKAINDIEQKGGKVYYCDTDSIICNLDISKHPDLMAAYMSDGKGDALGTLKNECVDKIKKELKGMVKDKKISSQESKDIFDNQLKIDDNFNHFDELIISGCKFYSLKKTLYNGVEIEINKLKGFKQTDEDTLNFNTFELLNNKEIDFIEQDQLQFVCPKSFYTSESDKFRITTKKTLKKFKINYSKGLINESGEITPLII